MFSDEDLLPISGLQHLNFCERQWALIHMEQEWSENVLTIEGSQLHEHVHKQGAESRGNVRLVRGLRLRSLRLGLYGVADLVEFHDAQQEARPYPVEYKRGRKRPDRSDDLQLCAQALCLEEMLSTRVPEGAVYYGQPRRRSPVLFSAELRGEVERLCKRARELYKGERIPPPLPARHCSSCSLVEVCMPNISEKDRTEQYLNDLLQQTLRGIQ